MGRDEATRASSVRAAKFAPIAKSFASWKPELSSIDTDVQRALIALEWARRKEALVLAGPSGPARVTLPERCHATPSNATCGSTGTPWKTLGNLLSQAKIDGTVTNTFPFRRPQS